MKNTFIISILFNIILAILLTYAIPYQFSKKQDPVKKISKFEIQQLAAKRIERIMKQSPKKISIVMLGNSITEYGGDWNNRLGRTDILNCGQGGYTTGQLIWLLDSCVISIKPRYCIILAGINDLSLGIPINKIFNNYQTIIDTLLANSIQPIVQSTLYQTGNAEGNVKVTYLNYLLEAYCKEKYVTFINMNEFMADQNGLIPELTTDRTHLSNRGYEIWSDKLAQVISELSF
ncbi:MAG: hypothetical protein JXR41_12535 [Bacteroidales bacterium]|nr:hypothetical protein [Bacteroidales bacterium]MBN2763913.1 hypothetical protein [Bacteroidales bacterium]